MRCLIDKKLYQKNGGFIMAEKFRKIAASVLAFAMMADVTFRQMQHIFSEIFLN